MRGFFLPFADLVVIAKEFYPIPFRTRPSKPSASMVLRLKPRESRTLPGLPRTEVRCLARYRARGRTRQHSFQKPPVTKVTGGFLHVTVPASRRAWARAAA